MASRAQRHTIPQLTAPMTTESYCFTDGNKYYLFDDLNLRERDYYSSWEEYVRENGLRYDIDYFLARQEGDEWVAIKEDKIIDDDKMFVRIDWVDVPLDQLISILKITTKLAGLYVLRLGYVRDLRGRLHLDDDLDDDGTIMMYGVADDLLERLSKLREDLDGIDVFNEMYHPIVRNYVPCVELAAKCYFIDKDCLIENKDHDGLFVVESKADVLSSLEMVASRYSTDSDAVKAYCEKEKEEMIEKINKAGTHIKDDKTMRKIKMLEDKIRVLEEENTRLKARS